MDKEHLSVVFIPFHLKNKNGINNFITEIEKISDKGDFSFIDSPKYHKYIENLINNPFKSNTSDNMKSGFLKIFKLDKFQRNDFLKYNAQKHDLVINKERILELSDHNYLLINTFSGIGFIVTGFIMKANDIFSECELFRFFDPDNEGNSREKYLIKVKVKSDKKDYLSINNKGQQVEIQFKTKDILETFIFDDRDKKIVVEGQNKRELQLVKKSGVNHTDFYLKDASGKLLDSWIIRREKNKNGEKDIEVFENAAINNFSLKELILDVFLEKCKDLIIVKVKKPILLHLFYGEKQEFCINHKNLEYSMFNMLRIKSNIAAPCTDVNVDLLTTTYSGVSICTLPEGASVLDTSVNSAAEIFNKYFPAFVIILNQRESMIDYNERISYFNYEELKQVLNQKDETNSEIIDELKKLKREIELFKLKQVIYSVSFFDEIVLFYKKLFDSFDIKTLLEDNQESVTEIYTLLADIEMQKEENRRNNEQKAKEIEILKEDKRRQEEEKNRLFERDKDSKISELRDQKINLVLLLLTIAQVWSGLFESLHLSEIKYALIINLIVYVFLIFVGAILYFSIDKQEKSIEYRDH